MNEKPRVYVLRNPSAAAAGGECELTEWKDADDAMDLVNPVLFLHGVEYCGINEVLDDLVYPFERSAGLASSERRDFIVLCWDSRLLRGTEREKLSENAFNRMRAIFTRMGHWHWHLHDAEGRARGVAAYFEPFFCKLKELELEKSNQDLLVVSHSLGGYLWASFLKMALAKRLLMPRCTWWNFQPAMPRSSFCPGGEFHEVLGCFRPSVAENYAISANAYPSIVLWFSRVDFILGTLYRIAKGKFALGQLGAPGVGNHALKQVDVTRLAGEAHGSNKIFGRARCFFTRIAPFIRHELMLMRQERIRV